MGLLRKFRILVGALVHRPFMPQPDGAEREGGPEHPREKGAQPAPGSQVAQGLEGERVADLIAEKRGDAAGEAGSLPASRERDAAS
jgi:hypothetical protein